MGNVVQVAATPRAIHPRSWVGSAKNTPTERNQVSRRSIIYGRSAEVMGITETGR